MLSLISKTNKKILRDLAKRILDISTLNEQINRTTLWKNFNSLLPQKPMFLVCLDDYWHDLIPESTLQCTDEYVRFLEFELRKSIFHFENIDDDRPVTDVVNIGSNGSKCFRVMACEASNMGTEPCIRTAEDLSRFHLCQPAINYSDINRETEFAQDVLGDILKIRSRGVLIESLGLTELLSIVRGVDQAERDFRENPKLLHNIMHVLVNETMRQLNTLEMQGMLNTNSGSDDMIGSAFVGATDELPGAGFDGCVRLKDLWAYCENQTFCNLSSTQYYDFILQYEMQILNRFGLVHYNLCGFSDDKLDLLLKNLRRLRRIVIPHNRFNSSVTERLGTKYILSWRPNPILFSGSGTDYGMLENDIQEALKNSSNSCIEFVLKNPNACKSISDAGSILKFARVASRVIRA